MYGNTPPCRHYVAIPRRWKTTISHVLLLARIVGNKDMTLGFFFLTPCPSTQLLFPWFNQSSLSWLEKSRNCPKIRLVQGHAVLGREFGLHVEVEYPKVDDCCDACESFHCEKFLYLLQNIQIFKQQIKENSHHTIIFKCLLFENNLQFLPRLWVLPIHGCLPLQHTVHG